MSIPVKITLTQLNYALSLFVVFLGIMAFFSYRADGTAPHAGQSSSVPESSENMHVAPYADITNKNTQDRHFGDWGLSCSATVSKANQCVMTQDTPTGARINLSLAMRGDGIVPRMEFLTPLGTFLPAGLTLDLEGQEPFTLLFRNCTQKGCSVYIDLADDVIAEFQNNPVVEISYVIGDKEEIKAPISLNGFADAFANLLSPALR